MRDLSAYPQLSFTYIKQLDFQIALVMSGRR